MAEEQRAGSPPVDHWVLDKRIPVALIISVVASTLMVGSTAVISHYRLGLVEASVKRLEERYDRDRDVRQQAERDIAARDRDVGAAIADLRATVVALRDTVSALRGAVGQPQQAPGYGGPSFGPR